MKVTDFGLKVKTKLITMDKTTTWLADEMGVSVSYISRILYGDRCSDKRLKQIKQILDIE